jgi:hypothetical protein
MEPRRLLSFFTGPTSIKPIITHSVIDQATLKGGGYMTVRRVGPNTFNFTLIGTTPSSVFSINQTRTRPHYKESPIGIGSITIKSGQLGAIEAGDTAVLEGPVTPVNDSMSAVALVGIGPNAKLDVNGDLGELTVGAVDLNPSGHINIAGDVSSGATIGALLLDGGSIHIQGGLGGGLKSGAITVQNGGSLAIGGSVTGGIDVAGPLTGLSNGSVNIGSDVSGAVTVGGDLNLSNGANVNVGRDMLGALTVRGNIVLDTGANLSVGRNLSALTTTGDITVQPAGGAISVGGNLSNLTVDGVFRGKGVATPDLNVGLDLDNLKVLGGAAGLGGLEHVSFQVGKNINGVNIQHGIFNSLITAGVSINGGATSPATGGNIGPDGTSAVFDSQILAGSQIVNLIINGDVMSDFPTNPSPTGYPTRIIAGVNRDGTFATGGLIDHFQILGRLIDAVVVASVVPYGGNGTLPPIGYGSGAASPGAPSGFQTYNNPRGTVSVGTFGSNTPYPNYTEISYKNEKVVGVAWAPGQVLTNDILPGGSINPSFASEPATDGIITVTSSSSSSSTVGSTSVSSSSSGSQTVQNVEATLAIPTTATVLGGVVSTPHGPQFDYAGILAADTSGVFVGPIPRFKG